MKDRRSHHTSLCRKGDSPHVEGIAKSLETVPDVLGEETNLLERRELRGADCTWSSTRWRGLASCCIIAIGRLVGAITETSMASGLIALQQELTYQHSLGRRAGTRPKWPPAAMAGSSSGSARRPRGTQAAVHVPDSLM